MIAPTTLAHDDANLEAAIDFTVLRLQTATTPKQRRAAWAALSELQRQRSATQIARMEAHRGLSAAARNSNPDPPTGGSSTSAPVQQERSG